MVSRNYVDEKALEAVEIRKKVDYYADDGTISQIRGYDDFRRKNALLDLKLNYERMRLRSQIIEDSRSQEDARRDLRYIALQTAIRRFEREVFPKYRDLLSEEGFGVN